CWDHNNKAHKNEQRLMEQNEYLAQIHSVTRDQIIERINSDMPRHFNKWMKPTFQSARFENDTLVFKVSGIETNAPFNASFLSVGASDPLTGTLSMVAEAFAPSIVDYITLNNIGLKFEVHNPSGKYHTLWIMTPDDVFNTYTNHLFRTIHNAPLRDYLLAGGR
ncbi:MAG: hypothetical protein K2I52_08570, partial [Muribaculaceae bacterium]|nr:hypothetical protein [Muribaculaceae bacterium]